MNKIPSENLETIDVLTLIPQRKPFVAVEQLHFCDTQRTVTSFLIKNDSIFVENGAITESGILENVAQTCAVRLGYLARGEEIKTGMIGAVNDFDILLLPVVGERLLTEIVVEAEVGGVILLSAKVSCNNCPVAQGKMKVALMQK